MKAAKKIPLDNVLPNGTIDNNKVARAILQYRNTPLPDLKLSPAQILFHRQLRDHIPTHPSHYQLHSSWVIDARQREEAFSKRNHVISEKYNSHAKKLPSLSVGTNVVIQNRSKKHQRRWIRSGVIVETPPNRQYRVRTNGSGRVTLQNRRFLRPATFLSPTVLPTPTNLLPASPSTSPLETTAPPTTPHPTAPMPAHPQPPQPTQATVTRSSSNILRRLVSHNAPGLLEQQPLAPRR